MQELVLGDGLRRNAIRFPEKEALVFQTKRLTYKNLNERANRLANALTEHGLKKGDKVAILLYNCSEFFEITFGLAKTGIIMVPLNYRSTITDLEYLINFCEANTVIFSEELEQLVMAAKPRLKKVIHFILVGEKSIESVENYDELLSLSSDKEPGIIVNEMDPLWIVFTSGTTGKPKACLLLHRGWTLQNLLHPVEHDANQDDVWLNTGPLHFLGQFCMCVVFLYIGAKVVIMKQVDALETLKLIERERITQSLMVPTLLNFILNLPDEDKLKWDLSSFRTLISATAPLLTKTKEGILKYFHSAQIYEIYSATELGIVTTLRPEDQIRKIRCCGRPFLGIDVKLLDSEGKEVPAGEIGELYMKGFNTFKEYYKNPEATRECRKDGWTSVGDMARMDEEGYYYIVDRKKDMIISGGVNIYPSEVDDVIQKHPDVLEVAVIGIRDEIWGESLKAVIVPREDAKINEEEIKHFCEGKLPKYKIPRTVDFVSSLPKSASGKILKSEIRARYWKDEDIKV